MYSKAVIDYLKLPLKKKGVYSQARIKLGTITAENFKGNLKKCLF